MPRFLAVLLLAVPIASAQSTPAAASDPNGEKKKIRLEGSVLSLAGGPASKAAVRLLPSGSQNGQPTSAYSKTADDAGKFVFEDVAPGRYTLTASKSGFVMGRYGARGPNGPGVLITVDSGQTMTALSITLTPDGVITGRITDQDGDPVAGSQVSALRSSYIQGRRQMVILAATVTDDQGNFRIPNLPPGRYHLSARPPIPGAAGDGGDRNGPHEANVPTYYPNSLDAANASPLNVMAGAELQGIDIRLRQLRVYEFKAKLVNGIDGSPATGVLNLSRYDPGSRNEWHPMGEQIRDGGKVDYHNLPPGTYVAEISSVPGPGGIGLGGRNEFTITDQNVDTVLTFSPTVSLSGTFKLEDGDLQAALGAAGVKNATAQGQAASQSASQSSGAANAPLNVSIPRVRIALSPAEGASNFGSNGQVKDDNTFVTTPTGPGKYLVDINGIPDGTYVKSIRYGGQDVTHAPLEVAAGAAGSIDVVLAANAADVSGTVRGSDDELMAGVRVIVWPKTPESGSSTGGIKSTSTDQNGNFKIGGFAPGSYYVSAWEDVDPALVQDPAFLAGFTSDAAEVKLSESSHESANVKPIPVDKIALEAAKIP
jgi:hypothetical protein